MGKNNSNLSEEADFGIGTLVYIPSHVKLVQYTEGVTDELAVPCALDFLEEPTVAPIVGLRESGNMVRVLHNGKTWWASGEDVYRVNADTIGSSLK